MAYEREGIVNIKKKETWHYLLRQTCSFHLYRCTAKLDHCHYELFIPKLTILVQ